MSIKLSETQLNNNESMFVEKIQDFKQSRTINDCVINTSEKFRKDEVNIKAVTVLSELNNLVNDAYRNVVIEWNRAMHQEQIEEIKQNAIKHALSLDSIETDIENLDNNFEKYVSESFAYDLESIKSLYSIIERTYYHDSRETFLYQNLIKIGYSPEHAEKMVRDVQYKEISKYEKIFKYINIVRKLKKEMEVAFTNIKSESDLQYDLDDLIGKVFNKYQEVIEQAKKSSSEIRSVLSGEQNLSDADIDTIANNLIERASSLLNNCIKRIISGEVINDDEILREISMANGEIMLLDQVIRQLPRDQIANLNLRQIEHIERMEELPARELLDKKDILEKIKKIIKLQFPRDDDEVFDKNCRNNNNLRLTITLANNEVLSFFSKESVSDNIDYIDWFMANPDAPIKGLGEATLRLGFGEGDTKSYYAVAKPHGKSFQILVENLGFVAFNGSTNDGEYKHHYTRIRKLSDDQNLETKKINEDELVSLKNTISTICMTENKIESFLYKDRELNICKIVYHNQTHHDDIKKTDTDGWLMTEIDRQNNNGYVLSRFIPESANKDNQTFYAVFEKDFSNSSLKEELAGVVLRSSSSHSDSKNALSS